MVEFLGVAPWVIIAGMATWVANLLTHRRETRKTSLEHSAQLEVSRDDLAIELLTSARAEVGVARAEMGSLREEITSLRAMEQHFFHFQQSLDHLAAILFASNAGERVTAERHARAFLKRMERLRNAKGTLANEAQIVKSTIHEAEKKLREEGNTP